MQKYWDAFHFVRVFDKKTAELVKATKAREAIFLDADGDEFHRVIAAEARGLEQALEAAARKGTPRDVAWASLDAKAPEGEKRPLVLVFTDDRKDSQDLLKALEDPWVARFHDRFLFVRMAFRRDSDEAKKWGVTQAPALVVAEAGKVEPLDRLSGKKGPRELKVFLLKSMSHADRK